jgi:hypothetical protein
LKDKLWLSVGVLNLVAGLPGLQNVEITAELQRWYLVLTQQHVPELLRAQSRSDLHLWYLALAPIGALNVIGALRFERTWIALLPLSLLCVPSWGAFGLFAFRSALVGLAFAAAFTGLVVFTFFRALRRSLSARKRARKARQLEMPAAP